MFECCICVCINDIENCASNDECNTPKASIEKLNRKEHIHTKERPHHTVLVYPKKSKSKSRHTHGIRRQQSVSRSFYPFMNGAVYTITLFVHHSRIQPRIRILAVLFFFLLFELIQFTESWGFPLVLVCGCARAYICIC